jgi:hypothetical protein
MTDVKLKYGLTTGLPEQENDSLLLTIDDG